MNFLPTISLLTIDQSGELTPFLNYLSCIQPIALEHATELPETLSGYDVILINQIAQVASKNDKQLHAYVQNGGSLLGVTALSPQPLPNWFGTQPAEVGPAVELRILFTDQKSPLRTRLPDSVYLSGRFHPLTITDEDVTTILYADWRYTHQPMLTERKVGTGTAAVTTLQEFGHKTFQQFLYRTIRQLAGQPNAGQTLGVGLLGYAPSVGQLHGQGAEATPGLELHAACDLSQERLDQAEKDFNGRLKLYKDSAAFAADPDIDVVIIATPAQHPRQTLHRHARRRQTRHLRKTTGLQPRRNGRYDQSGRAQPAPPQLSPKPPLGRRLPRRQTSG